MTLKTKSCFFHKYITVTYLWISKIHTFLTICQIWCLTIWFFNSPSRRKSFQLACLLIEGNGIQLNKIVCCILYVFQRILSFLDFKSTADMAVEAILHTFDANTYVLHTRFLKKVCIHTQECNYISHLVSWYFQDNWG